MRALFVQQQADCPPGFVGDRLLELGAAVEVVSAHDARLPEAGAFDLIVPLGSDDSAADDAVSYLRREWELLERAVAARVPVFGICFGAQLLCRVLGGEVTPAPGGPEIGWLPIDTSAPDLVEPGPWFVWHSDVMSLGPGCVEIARTGVGVHAYTNGPHVGVQFHPEVSRGIVADWASGYPRQLAHAGLDAAGLDAQGAAIGDAARRRAYALVDRVLAHACVPA